MPDISLLCLYSIENEQLHDLLLLSWDSDSVSYSLCVVCFMFHVELAVVSFLKV